VLLPDFGREEYVPPMPSISNRLLLALVSEDLDRLRPHFEPVSLKLKQTLSKPNTSIDHVYFVQEGMVSLVQTLGNGAAIEVGVIGNEGFVGIPVLLGANSLSKR
jgi:CRP-like cAMP-binding protein